MSQNTNNIGSGTSNSRNEMEDSGGCAGTGTGDNSNSTRPNTEEMEFVSVNSHVVSNNLTETANATSPRRTSSFSEDKNLVSNESLESLIDRSLRYLDNGRYSDLTIIVGKKEIKTHKMVLMMSSQYFEAQF